MANKQSSIDWLIIELESSDGHHGLKNLRAFHKNIIEQAKKMHEQEIVEAYARGYEYAPLYEIEKQEKDNPVRVTPKQYYQETYERKTI